MRTSTESLTDFSESQWQAIQTCGRPLGIDVDTQLVTRGAKQYPLRLELWAAAKSIGADTEWRARWPTATEIVSHLKEVHRQTFILTQTVLGGALSDYGHPELSEYALGWWEYLGPRMLRPSRFTMRERHLIEGRVRRALLQYKEALEDEAARFTALGPQSPQNAKRSNAARNRYLARLLWVLNEVGADHAPRKLQVNFLFACTKPLFANTSMKAVEHWFDRTALSVYASIRAYRKAWEAARRPKRAAVF
jgi:hypothetical protein